MTDEVEEWPCYPITSWIQLIFLLEYRELNKEKDDG